MQVKKASTYSKLIESAIECFAEKGIEQTKIIEISKAAGVSHSLLLYHFPTYEKLCMDVIMRVLETLKGQTIDAVKGLRQDPIAALKDYVYTPFRWANSKPDHFSIWMYFYYKSSGDPSYKAMNTNIRLVGRERIRNLILELTVMGHTPKIESKKLDEVCLIIQGLITGNTILAQTEESLSSEKMAELTYGEIKKLLNLKVKT